MDILIQNDWLLVSGAPVDALALPTRMEQSEQRLLEAEAELCNGSGDGQDIEGKQRRKAAAEGSFYRAWNALQGLRKELMQYELKLLEAKEKLAKLTAENEAFRKEQESQRPQAKAHSQRRSTHRFCRTRRKRSSCFNARMRRRSCARSKYWSSGWRWRMA